MKRILVISSILLMLLMSSCRLLPHEIEGQYIMNYINSDANRNKESDNYFFSDKHNIYCYSLKNGNKECCVSIDANSEYMISDFQSSDNYLFYVISNGVEKELYEMDYRTGEQMLLLSANDFIPFNEGRELAENDYVCVDIYNGYIFFAIVGKYEYICPIDGNIKEDSIGLHTLFDKEEAGDMQQIIYDEIVIERTVDSSGQYKISNIRDLEGYKILYSNMDKCINYNNMFVRFNKEDGTDDIQYKVDGTDTWNDIPIFVKDKYDNSDIDEDDLTVEAGKIIGILSVSKHWAESDDLNQYQLDKGVLFELDIETGESRILYDTKNNLTKIIGYQEGIMYFIRDEKIYAYELDDKKKTEIGKLPKGKDYIIDWQAKHLIIREEYGDIVFVHQLSN